MFTLNIENKDLYRSINLIKQNVYKKMASYEKETGKTFSEDRFREVFEKEVEILLRGHSCDKEIKELVQALIFGHINFLLSMDRCVGEFFFGIMEKSELNGKENVSVTRN